MEAIGAIVVSGFAIWLLVVIAAVMLICVALFISGLVDPDKTIVTLIVNLLSAVVAVGCVIVFIKVCELLGSATTTLLALF